MMSVLLAAVWPKSLDCVSLPDLDLHFLKARDQRGAGGGIARTCDPPAHTQSRPRRRPVRSVHRGVLRSSRLQPPWRVKSFVQPRGLSE